ncbi:ornithine cyclodeaminase family protein [Thermoactinospora rubra]|uniref:ornithine cyclodeaminase family protein n=1 Tax=Thermoactinospora rubra TaxID=1088767 RepID=UPI000A1042B0|nr:ornithine cyclodeaminase [Thermoactinospora rubra]
MDALPYLDADTLAALVPLSRAVEVLEQALRDGLDPERTPPRAGVPVPGGELLMMPAGDGRYAGVKVVSVAPANPARGLPRIQGTYLLFDGDTLRPLAVLDGMALTSLRTPAVSAVAVSRLVAPHARRLVLFGTGPQAWGHLAAIRAIRPLEHVTVVGRNPAGVGALASHCRRLGLRAESLYGPAGTATGQPADEHAGRVAEAVALADIVACCTTARTPLFPGKLARDGAAVVAVGSHEPDAREVDEDLVARATVVVESRAAALAEAGDVIIPVRNGTITTGHLAGNLADLVSGRLLPGPGPRLFKSVGMAWEDLVVAAAAHEAATARRPG